MICPLKNSKFSHIFADLITMANATDAEDSVKKRLSSEVKKEPQGDLPTENNTSGGSFPFLFTNGNSKSSQEPEYKTTNEYCCALRQWMQQYHQWNQMNMMTQACWTAAVMNQMCNVNSQRPNTSSANSNNVGNTRNIQQNARQNIRNNARVRNAQILRREYRIPQLWKRVAAEFIDFFLLFTIKVLVTIATLHEYADLIDLEKYDIENLFNPEIELDKALSFTTELIVLEIVNRVFIIIFEMLCLRHGIPGPGGATPGKRIMGLRVVLCTDVEDLGDGRVRVMPGGDIGTWNALVRSVIKNFSFAFFFPVCFTALFFQHGRAAYDTVSNSLVVQDDVI